MMDVDRAFYLPDARRGHRGEGGNATTDDFIALAEKIPLAWPAGLRP